jgi:hydroxymethylpyrimidine pyrophosphatase-like HAD family hydrolase
MNKTIHKSVAIARILEIENSNFHEIISFCYNYNDERMLNVTAIGLVMRNALNNLKSKLFHHEIISTNDADGVAKLLSERVLNRKTTTVLGKQRRIGFIVFKVYFCVN